MLYENYINGLKPDTSYIPESATINDISIFAERACQDAFNEAFFALATNEIAVFESMIFEADNEGTTTVTVEQKKNIIQVIGKAIANIGSKIKGAFLNLIDKVKKKFAQFKKEHSDKMKSDFKKAIGSISADYKMKGVYSFEDIHHFHKEIIENRLKHVKELADKAYNNAGEKGWDDQFNKNVIVNILKIDEIKAPEKKEVTIADIGKAQNTIISYVFDENNVLKNIKTAYDQCKKNLKDTMKTAKDCINRKDKSLSELNAACRKVVKFCSDCVSSILKFKTKEISLFFNIRANYSSVMAKIIVKGSGKKSANSTENTDSDNTNAVGESAYVTDIVEESFGFINEEEDMEDDVAEMDDEEIEETALYQALVTYLG